MPEKYEREIDEVLRQMKFQPRRRRPSFRLWLRRTRERFSRLRPSSPGQLMLISFGLGIAALFLRSYSPRWGTPLGTIAIVLFILAFLTSFMRPGYRPQKRWRGYLVDETPTPWWEKLYRWLYRG
ncbi:MAG: hypothetical protein HY664_01560 [Chloroflexi bacterium]|nr:hypothetical protein [Chloroflexota bacterium]